MILVLGDLHEFPKELWDKRLNFHNSLGLSEILCKSRCLLELCQELQARHPEDRQTTVKCRGQLYLKEDAQFGHIALHAIYVVAISLAHITTILLCRLSSRDTTLSSGFRGYLSKATCMAIQINSDSFLLIRLLGKCNLLSFCYCFILLVS